MKIKRFSRQRRAWSFVIFLPACAALFPIFRMKSRRTVENGIYINEIPQGQFPPEAIRGDAHMRQIPYPEAEKITFFIYEEINACRLACQRLGLGKADVEKIFWSNSARIFHVE